MTIKQIPNFLAMEFASAYYDVVTMVDLRASPSGYRTPRQVLDRYLTLCDRIDVEPHGEAWLRHAHTVVEELEERHRRIYQKIFHPEVSA